MKPHDSLRRRIVSAYVYFSLGVSALLAIIFAFAVETIEVRLVDERLQEIAEWASPRHAGGLPVEMPTGVSFYHGASIPPSLRGLTAGMHDREIDGITLHVLAGRDSAGEYVVVDHESDFERIELIVYTAFALAFSGVMLFSFVTGRFVARHVVEPITGLTQAVRSRDATLPFQGNADEIGVLARTFTARTEELKQFLERERFFTGDVSHELRTPLTVIIGAAEILKAQTAAQPALQAPADRILRAAREAAESVNILLLLARAPERIEAEGVAVGPLTAELTARHQPLVNNKPVVLAYEGGDDFMVQARRELLSAAIGNLIRNACQYTGQGSVTVRLDRRAVIVEDTGPGLPDTVLQKLHDEPRMVPSTGSVGSGLGLALVKRIAEQLRAHLTVRARAGGGTIFLLQFPGRLTD